MGKHWIENIFESCGAAQDKNLIYPNARVVHHISSEIADQVLFRGMAGEIDIVVGPATGGMVLAYEISKDLNRLSPHRVLWVFTEEDGGVQVLKKPGFRQLVAGRRIMVVDDVMDRGEPVKQVVEAVEGSGGEVVAVAVIINRMKVSLPYPLIALWEPENEQQT